MAGQRLLEAAADALGRIVAVCCRRARTVAVASLVIATVCGAFVAGHFEISTDLDALLDASLPWKAQARHLEQAFPDQGEDITVLVDGATPELAEQAAARLTQALQPQTGVFQSVQRVNGGAFFDREGLLYSSLDEVREGAQGLIAAQPLLAQLESAPDLAGLMGSLALGLDAAQADPDRGIGLQRAVAGIQSVLAHADDAEPVYLSWRALLGSAGAGPADWRQFIEIIPRLDYQSAAPGAAATRAVRDAARRLALDPAHGTRIRITGSAPIADEELATLAESGGPIALAMLLAMLGILYMSTRSVRAIVAMLLTVACGAVVTTAIGLALLGRFNLISVAFLPLFVGLGIDFCIQLHARAGAESGTAALSDRLARAAQGIGRGLLLAAAAIAVGFFAFLPTSYRGVSELGLVAGVGILIALLAGLTLLPALLCLLRAPIADGHAPPLLRRGGALLARRRWQVMGAAALAAMAAAVVLPALRFDSDPMHLRNPRSEAVAAYFELSRSVDTTPNTVSVVAPDMDAAVALAQRLRTLPEVGAVLTVQSFVPGQQAEKLALIADARDLLEFTLHPLAVAPPPNDAGIVAALHRTAARLHAFHGGAPAFQPQLTALADALEVLARAPSQRRDRVGRLLLQGLPTALAQIATSLSAEPVTTVSLPPWLRRQWLAPGGAARVEIAPATPLLTMQDTARFVAAVRRVAPDAAGDAVTVVESGRSILAAFLTAGSLSLAGIALLLYLALGRSRDVMLVTAPILLAGLLAFATCAALRLPLNLENMIALPLLFGIGVAFNIYFVAAGGPRARHLLESSLGRGILCSALTTGTSFAALMLSSHPGTASMGALLLIALTWIVVTSVLVTPALAAVTAPEAADPPQRSAAVI